MIDLPKIGEPLIIRGAGNTEAQLKAVRSGAFTLRTIGLQRTRWGNADQIREDVAHFMECGALPLSKCKSWA